MEINKINQEGLPSRTKETDVYEVVGIKNIENSRIASSKELDFKSKLEELNKYLDNKNTYAKYEIHKGFGDIIVKIIDKDSNKVIQEFPPEKILDMIEAMCKEAGIMLDKKA